MSILSAFAVPHPPLIIPDVGRGEEKKVSATVAAYEEVGRRIAEIKPDTIIISTPHSIMYSDYIHISPGEEASGDFSEFGVPNVSFKVQYDKEFADKICELAAIENLSAGKAGEKNASLDHGTMISCIS
ncbi:MAG: hypothetical protein IJC39_02565 [Firmicutes bacterium]|nr:hypothetical protein [Bacillota bacterium]